MSTREVPEPWASRMVDRGFTQRDGRPNISALARRAEVAVETVRRMVHGVGEAHPDTVSAVADLLGSEVYDWSGRIAQLGPYQPPAASALLTGRERRALDELIHAMTEREEVGSDVRSAPIVSGQYDPNEITVMVGGKPVSLSEAQREALARTVKPRVTKRPRRVKG